MKRVAVIMSCYNGELYLKEQIDSILAQENVEVDLYIRDDASKDRTVQIIQEQYPDQVRLTKGENMGVGNSFMSLLYSIPMEYDYFAFSDQDDIWEPDKLSGAVVKLQNVETPVLYASNQMLVDKNGQQMGLRYQAIPPHSALQIISNNYLAGCTMVWNRALQSYVSEPARRASVALLKNRIHDVWMGAVAASIGELIYDEKSYILYRQHENNVVGVRKSNLFKVWMKKINDPSKRNGRSLLAQEIYQKYQDLIQTDSLKKQIRILSQGNGSIAARMNLAKYPEFAKYSGESVFMYRLKVLMGLV